MVRASSEVSADTTPKTDYRFENKVDVLLNQTDNQQPSNGYYKDLMTGGYKAMGGT